PRLALRKGDHRAIREFGTVNGDAEPRLAKRHFAVLGPQQNRVLWQQGMALAKAVLDCFGDEHPNEPRLVTVDVVLEQAMNHLRAIEDPRGVLRCAPDGLREEPGSFVLLAGSLGSALALFFLDGEGRFL